MKRYLLFGGDDYYPGGGAEDFLSAHDGSGKAEKAGLQYIAESGSWKWAHVYDIEMEAIVWASNSEKEQG